MLRRQLELTLSGGKIAAAAAVPTEAETANWWFEQMRSVVNQGCEAADGTREQDRDSSRGWRSQPGRASSPLGLSRKMVLT